MIGCLDDHEQKENDLIIGLLFLGSAAGLFAGVVALFLGQSFAVALAVYAMAGVACIFGIIARCAFKTLLIRRAADPSLTLPEAP